MNTKTVYIANDGTEFNNQVEAETYEDSQLSIYVSKHAQVQEVLDHLESHESSEEDFYGTPHEIFLALVKMSLENKREAK